ncbi:phosphoribosylglycinamide formyltransferase [Rhodoblastus sphagnicola]|uniref:Phosphoribosylglycinamide formyltransferase n=1 Tax=Rhodoblastus sphagnicola TaxID=333368 RepID=A0A2S6N5E7_9HYPH|nr:phosphoribosylglycinamide formyltransferase [Rhodoblastus sphagnicola]MBB4197217.1 phosphoribosylglycinamide formyltransferase-1 [Rhodoblastus sphagnicola]PPQ29829.1 phosphoribosylglycinamide formyltransferase [Rhodoblastus sphagnicola]
MSRKRVAILISGRGSNMRALIAAAKDEKFPAEIALVLSNVADAGGLDFAHGEGIATAVVDHKAFASRENFERAVQAALEAKNIELVCLAGFMRLLSPWFVENWRGRMLNVHPALLPSYRGLHTHERALADGVKIHGATVHFVVPEMDAGPIVAQAAVAVRGDDTPEILGARVLEQEHVIYPRALALVASGAALVEGARVRLAEEPAPGLALVSPAADFSR